VIIRHQPPPESAQPQPLQVVDLGIISSENQTATHEVFANLQWPRGGTLVLVGALTSDSPTTFSVSILLSLGCLSFIASLCTQVSKVVMDVVESHWNIEMSYDLRVSRNTGTSQCHWLSHSDPINFLQVQRDDPCHTTYVSLRTRGVGLIICFFSVCHRPHVIDVSLSHQPPAYLDEEYPIIVSVTNVDDHDLNVVVDVLLHPAEDDTGMFSYGSSTDED
jgi:trafficking protein particle complex subunit 11